MNDLAVLQSELPKFFSAVHMVPLRATCRLYSGAKAPEVGLLAGCSEPAGGGVQDVRAGWSACGWRLGVA